MKLEASHLTLVAAELKTLLELPITTKDELERWDIAADVFRKKLYSIYRPIYETLPHELEHFLIDSDIRLKEPGYKTRQNEFIANLIANLEKQANR